MRWVSIADIQASLDPATRAANQRQHMELCVTQAKLEQAERHHHEKMQVDIETTQIQARALLEREHISGQNAIALADRAHVLTQSANSSALIDMEYQSHLKEQEEWSKTMADALRQLVIIEADTIRQERLKALDQKHIIEKIRLESNLKLVEMMSAYEIQNNRFSYEKSCEIAFKLVERTLGLGEDQIQPDQIRDWVQEAMGQAGAMNSF